MLFGGGGTTVGFPAVKVDGTLSPVFPTTTTRKATAPATTTSVPSHAIRRRNRLEAKRPLIRQGYARRSPASSRGQDDWLVGIVGCARGTHEFTTQRDFAPAPILFSSMS